MQFCMMKPAEGEISVSFKDEQGNILETPTVTFGVNGVSASDSTVSIESVGSAVLITANYPDLNTGLPHLKVNQDVEVINGQKDPQIQQMLTGGLVGFMMAKVF